MAAVEKNVSDALDEDIGPGDLSAPLLAACRPCTAEVYSRSEAVLCGRPWFDACFRLVEPAAQVRVDWLFEEGAKLAPGDRVCVVKGPPAPLLSAERTALNFLQTLSATATVARQFAAAAGSGALVVDTRKTLPGLRRAQKYAVRVGGAANHRIGLYDCPLLKENHAAACGGLEALLRKADQAGILGSAQVEVRSADELEVALRLGARRIMLDNFAPKIVGDAVRLAREKPEVELEASGGVTLDKLGEYAGAGVARISVGALTKDVAAIDFSLQVVEHGREE